jgi:hypothetical protein
LENPVNFGPDIPLHHCDKAAASRAVERLRGSHPGAEDITKKLDEAIRTLGVPAETFVQHSKWCHTGGSWTSGIEPARAAALAMYRFVPDRLCEVDGSMDAQNHRDLATYREHLSDPSAAPLKKARPPDICPKCFTKLPVSGTCDNCA